jgi:hypothetical protein
MAFEMSVALDIAVDMAAIITCCDLHWEKKIKKIIFVKMLVLKPSLIQLIYCLDYRLR